MTEDRGDWVVDTEGTLPPPGGDGLKPPTDEFGRDDPASLERERRRREREARRGKSRQARKLVKPTEAKPAVAEPSTSEPPAVIQPPAATAEAPRRLKRTKPM